ncbi:MAG: hypothetical protein F6K47_30330 [Symploca sp. SIO2E6]|nr:hypothetical protein [Symploca sp. SIO2E6]
MHRAYAIRPYGLLEADAVGVIKSRQFPGLWLAVADLLSGDMVKVLTTVQEGLNSAEHRQFVQQLAEKRLPTAPAKLIARYLKTQIFALAS